MNNYGLLIAETDERGSVPWLWRADYGKRPKPVENATSCMHEIGRLDVFGASKAAVEAWLTQQIDQHAQPC